MRPSARLDLWVAPADPDAEPAEAAEALLARWRSEGRLAADGSAGPAAGTLVDGGFARVWLDRPGRVGLIANRQGGFRVACPACGANLVPAFVAATEAWRAGGPRSLTCPACGAPHPLEALDFRPPAAFARLAVVLSDVSAPRPTPEAEAALADALGPLRIVARRG